MYVLDTNSFVYFFKGLGNVAERFLQTPPSEIALSAVVLYELEVGLAKTPEGHYRRLLGHYETHLGHYDPVYRHYD